MQTNLQYGGQGSSSPVSDCLLPARFFSQARYERHYLGEGWETLKATKMTKQIPSSKTPCTKSLPTQWCLRFVRGKGHWKWCSQQLSGELKPKMKDVGLDSLKLPRIGATVNHSIKSSGAAADTALLWEDTGPSSGSASSALPARPRRATVPLSVWLNSAPLRCREPVGSLFTGPPLTPTF